METVDIIKQQQEVAREEINLGLQDGTLTPEKVDTLITTIITNIGRELEARCEGERVKEPDHAGYTRVEAGMYSYAKGNNEAIDRTLTIIRSITGISPTR